MHIESERKFLVKGQYKDLYTKNFLIKQAFLNSDFDRSVRVRTMADEHFLTIKGPLQKDGTSRYEWEKEITADEADKLYSLCEPGMIEKIRHLVPYEKMLIEVDEFLGDNEGLVLAEIEFNKELNTKIMLPEWLGEEVTGDEKYYNTYLIRHPYSLW